MRPLSVFALMLAAPLLIPAGIARAENWDYGRANVPDFQPAFDGQTRAPKLQSGVELQAETIATGLDHPWGIEVMPDGALLVTERAGRLRLIAPDGTVGAPIKGVPQVHAEGQGGLLDVALSPGFAQDRGLYLTYAKPVAGGSATAAARARLSPDGTSLQDVTEIFVQTPASRRSQHYGSRIVIDGDHLYITTGEHFAPSERVYAQDLDKTYGKVVRLTRDGGIPADNPFAEQPGALGAIWTLGHRNVQGAAMGPDGRLWALEHGPKGGDELNLIQKGANYGWPVVSYGENYSGSPVGSGAPRAPEFTEPRYYWDPVIAPGNFLFYDGAMFADWQGDILIASLNPGGVVRLKLDGDRITGEERFRVGKGRVRDLAVAPDGALLALIDADDGAVLRLTPESGG